ncbi:nucleoside triphosphate pyrophosphohydrolase [Porcipelethomonas sp.]|uniref:nucleoside triphosphate pyrophosphohydrolase n=1 Tax=Porcipelethomonas sp. TaxID=2981675 RepID=UPI003EF13EDD
MVEFEFKETYNIDDLLEIMAILRSPEGCPWDREQTHGSIRQDFIEEVYEAVEAIDLDDRELLREELGDVLLQVVFHCQIEKEKESFAFADICDELCKKLIVRHPHVFGQVTVADSGEVLKNWDSIKKETKGQKTYGDTLESVAKSLPALMRAQKLGKRAMRAGMDFKGVQDAFECVKSETSELEEAIAQGNQEHIEEELGDLIFSCVNTARHLGIDAEQALDKASEKFIKRFKETEKLVTLSGADMKALSIDELDAYWRQAKQNI